MLLWFLSLYAAHEVKGKLVAILSDLVHHEKGFSLVEWRACRWAACRAVTCYSVCSSTLTALSPV